MSSVKRRIIIEEYIDGGFGILEYGKEDIMGLKDELEVFEEVAKKLNQKK
jgi:hypothetical protein